MLRFTSACARNGTVTSIPEWLKTDHPREGIEAAFARSYLFERRRILMDDWERYLAQGSEEEREL